MKSFGKSTLGWLTVLYRNVSCAYEMVFFWYKWSNFCQHMLWRFNQISLKIYLQYLSQLLEFCLKITKVFWWPSTLNFATSRIVWSLELRMVYYVASRSIFISKTPQHCPQQKSSPLVMKKVPLEEISFTVFFTIPKQ